MCQHMASLLPEVSPHKQDQVDQEEASVCEWSCHGQAPETALVRPTLRLPLSATLSTSSTKFSMNSASYSTSLGAVEKNLWMSYCHFSASTHFPTQSFSDDEGKEGRTGTRRDTHILYTCNPSTSGRQV